MNPSFMDWIKRISIGDEIKIVLNGEPITGIVQGIEVRVVKILNPRGVIIAIPEYGEFELG